MPTASSRNQASLSQSSDLLSQFKSSLIPSKPWETIIDFATHPSFCGLRLYPRQQTLLKLIYLETENMTSYDLEVIEEWRSHFGDHDNPYGVQQDIWERIEYLKNQGYDHFPHIEAVQGRRASKGLIGGLLGTERLAHLVSLDNWQETYGIQEGKQALLPVVATNQLQAQRFLFADLRGTVERCKWLAPYISESKEHKLTLRTPSDIRQIAEMQKRKLPIDREIASIMALAMSSTSASGRGGANIMNIFDEFAHMITGTGGPRTSDEVYEAYQPSLDQFGRASMTYIPSSPLCLQPGTRVLKESLEWVPVETLELGDRLIGFDEFPPPGKGQSRTWQPSIVTETSIIQAPRYKLTLESGKEIIGTKQHLWLARRVDGIGRGKGRGRRSKSYPQNWCWITTEDLRPGDKIKTIGTDPWEYEDTRDAGYLAGFYDGEGHVTWGSSDDLTFSIGGTQNNGAVQDKVLKLLDERNFKYTVEIDSEKCRTWRLNGGRPEVLRFLGTIKPERLLQKIYDRGGLYGGRIYGGRKGYEKQYDTVVSVEYYDEGPVVALGTSTSTLIAEGLLSHNTKVGKFYELYVAGKVLTQDYLSKQEGWSEKEIDEIDQELDAEEGLKELTADPEMLIIQLPSWELYRDWERGRELVKVKFKGAIQVPPSTDNTLGMKMLRLQKRNPQKFSVERGAQFAEVIDGYLDPEKVDQMFKPFWGGRVLKQQDAGQIGIVYQGHSDPSRTNANFAFAIGHLEKSPEPDEYGEYWNHVIIDRTHVWKPSDFEDHTVNYVQIFQELRDVLLHFPSIQLFTFDQFNSPMLIDQLKRDFAQRSDINCTVREATFTKKRNDEFNEKFKSALNLGWVHAPKDDFYNNGEGSLLEMEMKFLVEKNGRIDKQPIGPVQTKDLFDCVQEVTVRLLLDQLNSHRDRLNSRPSFGLQGGYPRAGQTDVPPTSSVLNQEASQNRSVLDSWKQGGLDRRNARSRSNLRGRRR